MDYFLYKSAECTCILKELKSLINIYDEIIARNKIAIRNSRKMFAVITDTYRSGDNFEG